MGAPEGTLPPGSGSPEAANEALNAITLHEKLGVPAKLAQVLAAAGVIPDPRLREELEREIVRDA